MSSLASVLRWPPRTAESQHAVSGWFHALASAWVVAMLWLGGSDPPHYRMLLQEDRIVEWGTVWLFFVAGLLGLRRSLPARRVFDGLVALFCLFVAGEEFSWGQRLLGYFPPEFFLRNNAQQEFSLHNLPPSVQPGSILMVVLAGYGLLLPLLFRIPRTRPMLEHLGVTPPQVALVPWCLVAILLLWWYPLTLTGEWVEFLAGGLFLISMRPGPTTLWPALVLTITFGASMTSLASALERGRDETRLACSAAEVRSLADDVAFGRAGTDTLWTMRRVHKRIWSSINDGYVDADHLRRGDTDCGEPTDITRVRRRYGIDPWGSPYWLLVERDTPREWRVTVYSFGPNRRRDIAPTHPDERHDDQSPATMDDVAATRVTRRLQSAPHTVRSGT